MVCDHLDISNRGGLYKGGSVFEREKDGGGKPEKDLRAAPTELTEQSHLFLEEFGVVGEEQDARYMGHVKTA